MYEVVFYNAKGELVTKLFASPYLAKKFARKLEHSKTCTLVSCPA